MRRAIPIFVDLRPFVNYRSLSFPNAAPPITVRSSPMTTSLRLDGDRLPYKGILALGGISMLTDDILLYISRYPIDQRVIQPTEWALMERYPTGNGLWLGNAWEGAEWRIAPTEEVSGSYRANVTNYEGQPDYWYGYNEAPVFAVEIRREGGLPETGNGFLQLVNQ